MQKDNYSRWWWEVIKEEYGGVALSTSCSTQLNTRRGYLPTQLPSCLSPDGNYCYRTQVGSVHLHAVKSIYWNWLMEKESVAFLARGQAWSPRSQYKPNKDHAHTPTPENKAPRTADLPLFPRSSLVSKKETRSSGGFRSQFWFKRKTGFHPPCFPVCQAPYAWLVSSDPPERRQRMQGSHRG